MNNSTCISESHWIRTNETEAASYITAFPSIITHLFREIATKKEAQKAQKDSTLVEKLLRKKVMKIDK